MSERDYNKQVAKRQRIRNTSQKGRWLMRKYLFFLSMRVVVLTNYFKT
jgi:hypothetical protein